MMITNGNPAVRNHTFEQQGLTQGISAILNTHIMGSNQTAGLIRVTDSITHYQTAYIRKRYLYHHKWWKQYELVPALSHF
jgi:hypothetical protein